MVLVEAKAHVAELTSNCHASPTSRARIERALAETKAALGARAEASWLTGYYQYANRLAHLRFFQSHGVPAVLVCVYFTHDADMRGPKSAAEWQSTLHTMYEYLGLPPKQHVPGAVNVFLDTRVLGARGADDSSVIA